MLFQEEAGCSNAVQSYILHSYCKSAVRVAEESAAYEESINPQANSTALSCGTQSYLQAIGKARVFTREEEQFYARQLRQGELLARQKMVVHNLRLVVKIARSYLGSKLSLLELISEGNIGLFYALEKFNPDLGYKFSTYATPWIRQAIERSILVRQRLIRTPYRLARRVRQLQRARNKLAATDAQATTAEQLAACLGWSVQEVRLLSGFDYQEYSLDSTYAESERAQHEVLPAQAKCPCTDIQNVQLEKLILELVHQLPKMQQSIVVLRFGLFGNQAHTLQGVASIMGVSRERVRLMQIQVLQRMKRELEQHGLSAELLFSDAAR